MSNEINKYNIVLYHANCTDGIASAWVAEQFFLGEGIAAKYIPVQYGTPPPFGDMYLNRDIYILDFSYPIEVLREIKERVNKVVLLDHHPHSQEIVKEMEKIDGMDGYYDSERCGAILSWDYFFPEEDRPEILKYVDDYDRWVWQYPETEAVSEMLRLKKLTLDYFDSIVAQWNINPNIVLDKGNILNKKKDNQIEQLAESAIHYTLDGIPLMGVNAPPEFSSRLGHKLAELSASGCAFTWYRRNIDSVLYSVRSVDKEGPADMRVTARELAVHFGGGGHEHAAGFASAHYPEEILK